MQTIISLIIVMVTIIGSTIPLYIHLSKTSQNQIQAIQIQIQAIQEEMKDFHGRLCAIEERNKKGNK